MLPSQQANEKTGRWMVRCPCPISSRVSVPRRPSTAMVTGLDDALILLGNQQDWGETASAYKVIGNTIFPV